MHDGSQPYDGVLETIQHLKNRNKLISIVSNSSKRKDNSIRMLQKLGFDIDDFHQVLTSGEIAHQMLSMYSLSTPNAMPSSDLIRWDPLINIQQNGLPRNVVVLGSGDDDEEYCTSCGWNITPLSDASLIVARGTFTINEGNDRIIHKRQGESIYEHELEKLLNTAAQRRIAMLITNPDKIRPDIERPPMPGKIGDMYECMLQREDIGNSLTSFELVKRIGKPFRDIYTMALERNQTNDSESLASSDRIHRVCMVGDALETDVTGGALANIDTIWILSDGIHTLDLPNGSEADDLVFMSGSTSILDAFNHRACTYAKGINLHPTAVLRHFHW
jgi:ribonucleotide monophosphatase NagD (HAD superfamily)